jgi:GT2 family glycosyltransferase
VIDALRRLLGRKRRLRVPCAAPLGESLVLVVSRRRSLEPGHLRSAASFGRYRVSIFDVGETDQRPPAAALAELVESLVPRLDQRERRELFEFVLAASGKDLHRPGAISLASALRLLRDRLRDPLPELVPALASGVVLMPDTIIALDPRSFWIAGWSVDTDQTLAELEIISPEGQRTRLLEGAYRYPRADVEESLASAGIRTTEKHGFAKYVELPFPSPLNEGWLSELRNPAGGGFDLPMPRVIRDSAAAYERVLGEISVERPDSDVFRRDHACPSLMRLQEQKVASVEVESEVQHGLPPEEPDVSIIVPLYERIDLIEHQLAHFWQDHDIRAAELIYVLDSPELRDPLTRLAGPLHDLYGIAFKVLELNRNSGYSTANNVGAAHARGRLLLLLNSDVLPVRQGWLSKLRAFYDATPQIGALGPKLLYEDESIQHAGMYFQRDSSTHYWENQHYFKGFSRWLPAANVSRPVPAVTGACLMIDRELYRDLGGLSPMYLRGGYEDSELCLRLVEAGRRNWYFADVELYHLEAQSFPIHARATNRYNAWLQTHLWDERIDRTMSEHDEAAAAGTPRSIGQTAHWDQRDGAIRSEILDRPAETR